jgi:hypothetical protein
VISINSRSQFLFARKFSPDSLIFIMVYPYTHLCSACQVD